MRDSRPPKLSDTWWGRLPIWARSGVILGLVVLLYLGAALSGV